MRFSKWLLLGCVAGLGSPSLQAQTATPEQINQAIELLRKTQTGTNVLAPVAPAIDTNKPLEADKQVQQMMQNLQTSPPPAAITDPRTLRETSQQAESAARTGQLRPPGSLEGQRPSSLAEEQAMRARVEEERQRELRRIEAEVNRIRQSGTNVAVQAPAPAPAPTPPVAAAAGTAPATAPTALSPETEARARALLDQLGSTPTAPAVTAPAPVVAPPPISPPAQAQVPPPQTPPAVVPEVTAPAPITPRQDVVSPDMQQKAREMLEQVMKNTQAAKPPQLAAPRSGLPAITIAPTNQPVGAVPSSTTRMSYDQERMARDLLDRERKVLPPAAVPAPGSPSAPRMTLEQERKAREVLERALATPVVAAPAPPATPAIPPTATVATPVIPAPEPIQPTPPPTVPPPPPPPVVQTTPTPEVALPAAPVLPATAIQVPPPVRGLTPEQEQEARALLERAMGQTTTPSAPAVPAAPLPPVMATTPPPVAPSPAVPPPVVTGPAITPEQEEQARKLLEETFARDAATPSPDMQTQERARREVQRLDKESKLKAREAARKRLLEESKQQPAAPAGDTTTREATAGSQPKKGSPAPAPTIPTGPRTKQQRLATLLDAYLADMLTPEQYHTQRAQILAEP